MDISLFVDVPFNSDEAWENFTLLHGVEHQTTYEGILRLDASTYFLPLFEFDKEDNETYLYDHWQVHVANALALGIPGIVDLSTFDFSDEGQYTDWLALHAQVHLNEQQALA